MHLSVCSPISRPKFKPVVMPTNSHITVAVATIRKKVKVSFLEDGNWTICETHTEKEEKISLQQRTNNKSGSHKARLLPATAHSSRRQQTGCLCNQNIWVSNGKTEGENSLRRTHTAWWMPHTKMVRASRACKLESDWLALWNLWESRYTGYYQSDGKEDQSRVRLNYIASKVLFEKINCK